MARGEHMNTKIYSIFPACGKTWLYEHQEDYDLKILDIQVQKDLNLKELPCNQNLQENQLKRN